MAKEDANIERIPLVQIHVRRDGKRVAAKPGVPFKFTQGEIDDMKKVDEQTGFESFRLPINEGSGDAVANSNGGRKGRGDSTAAADTEL